MTNRRQFLKLSLGATAFALPALHFTKTFRAALPAPGVQLFTFYNVLDEDVEGTLKVVLNAPLDGHVAVTLLSPWKLITIGDEGLNPFPVTVTKLARGPEVGLIVITGPLEVDS